jgi:hypothetical protein
MNTYTIEDIRKLGPCYDPTRYLSEDWTGTVIDILEVADCPPQDRLWVATELLDDRTNRLFAVWCAREALKPIDNPDPRSVEACNVAERYANGQATGRELAVASAAAYAAAMVAANEAYVTAEDDARATAYTAAYYAAAYATHAKDAARDAARVVATRESQVQHLIKMLESGG